MWPKKLKIPHHIILSILLLLLASIVKMHFGNFSAPESSSHELFLTPGDRVLLEANGHWVENVDVSGTAEIFVGLLLHHLALF